MGRPLFQRSEPHEAKPGVAWGGGNTGSELGWPHSAVVSVTIHHRLYQGLDLASREVMTDLALCCPWACLEVRTQVMRQGQAQGATDATRGVLTGG